MSGEVEWCPILHVCPKFNVFTLSAHRPSDRDVNWMSPVHREKEREHILGDLANNKQTLALSR